MIDRVGFYTCARITNLIKPNLTKARFRDTYNTRDLNDTTSVETKFPMNITNLA